ncbi:hypothetical protein TIFTF001_007592 [Ficus carica]|uniref:Uncharacterized protein n=1 Tax=Ficus carica TaxID=3494 RepID=A0AA88A391_FICCA|nr:hypothetical protein TIFTF001_007592 [Ficus carica]
MANEDVGHPKGGMIVTVISRYKEIKGPKRTIPYQNETWIVTTTIWLHNLLAISAFHDLLRCHVLHHAISSFLSSPVWLERHHCHGFGHGRVLPLWEGGGWVGGV